MRRAILLLAAFLSLCVMPWMASLHGAQMALSSVAAPAHDHAPAISHHAAHDAGMPAMAMDCASQQPCGLVASLCGWVCASGPAAPLAHSFAGPRLVPLARLAPTDDILFKGITPPLNERPPNSTLRWL
jgi:hypothetical protein